MFAVALGAACTAPAPAGDDDAPGGGAAPGDGDSGDGDIDPFGDGDGDIDPGDGDGGGGPSVCGNGLLTPDEACDDGNTTAGDGCATDCLLVEPGFICREPGAPCDPFAKCGDGLVSFPEQCDDGGIVPDDGCSATCKTEIGWKCAGAPSTCSETTCGDGMMEGAELCDDGNSVPFDGCSVDCQIEPSCSVGGGCSSTCGDGIVLGDETCDDGNTIDGDGCSGACQAEDGYTCVGEPCETVGGECVLRIPIVLRDFASSHPDFGFYQNNGGPAANGGNDVGMVAATLDADGKPVPENPGNVTGLSDWYRDVPGTNSGAILGAITLFDDGNGNFVNRYLDDGTRWLTPFGASNCQQQDNGGMDCPVDGNPLFFPLDGHPNVIDPEVYDASVPNPLYGGSVLTGQNQNTFPDHNFHFTTEVAYWFVYDPDANATLTFVGDDDVWVFLNGTLAVDIGNKHEPRGGRITLGATDATIENANNLQNEDWTTTTRPIGDFGLEAGKAYEIKVFHAERETLSSSFQLTLAGFDTSKSDCTPFCGDGILGFGEECDDGDNDGGYNECQEGCVLGGYCGDGIVQETEACDDRDPNAPAGCSNCRIIVVR